MSDDEGVNWGQSYQVINLFFKATRDCTQRCGALKLDRAFDDQEEQCLKNCAVYHAGATSTHIKFIVDYQENFYLQQQQ